MYSEGAERLEDVTPQELLSSWVAKCKEEPMDELSSTGNGVPIPQTVSVHFASSPQLVLIDPCTSEVDHKHLEGTGTKPINIFYHGKYSSVKAYLEKVDQKTALCKVCRKKISSKTFNAARHMRAFHKDVYDRISEHGSPSTPSALGLAKHVAWDGSADMTPRHPPITSKLRTRAKVHLARFALSVWPDCDVNNIHFQRLLKCIPGFAPPSKCTLLEWASAELRACKELMSVVLHNEGRVHSFALSVDTCAVRGTVQGCTAVLVHFFDSLKGPRVWLLGVRDTPSPLTPLSLRTTIAGVLQEYALSFEDPRITRCILDHNTEHTPLFSEPFVYTIGESGGCISRECVEIGQSDALRVDVNPDCEGWCEPPLENDHREDIVNAIVNSGNLLISAVHKLQLVQQDCISAFDAVSRMCKEVFGVLGQLARSPTATQHLIKATNGDKLLFPNAMRFPAFHIAIRRLRDISAELDSSCESNGWNVMSKESWNVIACLLDVLEPVRGFTETLQKQEVPTISLLLPGLRRLCTHLERLSMQKDGLTKELACYLKGRLETRFEEVLNSGNDTNDPVYLCASVLDRTVSWMLEHADRHAAERCLIEMAQSPNNEDSCTDLMSGPSNGMAVNPFGFEVITENEVLNGRERLDANKRQLAKEVAVYVRECSALPPSQQVNPNMNVISFWTTHAKEFPVLSQQAIALLTVPASTAAVGTCFSGLGDSRSRLSSNHVEMRLIASFNSALFHSLV